MEYKTYPYLFSNTNATIIGAIKLYNSHALDKETAAYLIEEFNKLNPGALPPRLGQRVEIPVLLQYCEQHEKKKQPSPDILKILQNK